MTTATTAAPDILFPPPDEAMAIYAGEVMHARLKPMGHRFAYRVASMLIDLGRLREASRRSWLFGVNRAAPVSFHERDHGPRDGSPLRDWALAEFSRVGLDLSGGRILLLAYPRMLGYAFNPLAVYFGYDAAGALAGVIYEVRNTFGAMHHYTQRVCPDQLSVAGLRQTEAKKFYVSPFIPMEMHYRFRLLPPTGGHVRLRILETDAKGPLLAASFSGHRRPATTLTLAFLLLALPLMPLKVIGGIHWEALRLWLKGARYIPEQAGNSPGEPAIAVEPTGARLRRS